MKLYPLLKSLLSEVERTLLDNPTAETLAEAVYVSPVHLCRLFKSAFGTTLSQYIRARKLAVSLGTLYNTDFGLADIAAECGFEHAQSYIRAFRDEFGLMPGAARRDRRIVRVTPPLQLFPANELADGLLFGPDIVYVPRFCCVGRRHIIPGDAEAERPASAARAFWLHEKGKVGRPVSPDVYIGLTRHAERDADYTYYIPSVRVLD